MQAAGDAAVPNEHQFLRQMSGLGPTKREGTGQMIGGTPFKLSGHIQELSNDSITANQLNVGDRVLVQLKTSGM